MVGKLISVTRGSNVVRRLFSRAPGKRLFECLRIWVSYARKYLDDGSLTPNAARPLDVSDLVVTLFIPLITFALFLPFARIGVCPHHDGIMLKPALDVASGQTLFRDTFTQYGALTTYLQALFLMAFGRTLLVIKLTTVAAYGISAGLLYLCWRTMLPRTLAALAIGAWFLMFPFYDRGWIFLPWSSAYAIVFQSAAFLLMLHAIKRNGNNALALGSGIASGLTAWCRQPVGVLLFAALLGAYVLHWARGSSSKRRSGPFACCVAGFVCTNAVFIGHLLIAGAFTDWFNQNVAWPRLWAEKIMKAGGRPFVIQFGDCLFPSWQDAGVLVLIGALLLLPLCLHRMISSRAHSRRTFVPPFYVVYVGVAVIACVTSLIRLPVGGASWAVFPGGWAIVIPVVLFVSAVLAGGLLLSAAEGERVGWLVLVCANLVCLASWAQYYPVRCERHICWALAPTIGPFLAVILIVCRGRSGAVATGALLFLVPLAVYRAGQANDKLRAQYVRLERPSVLKNMLVPPDHARVYGAIDDAIMAHSSQHKSTSLLIEGPTALYGTFVTRLKNPGPIYIRWTGYPMPWYDLDRERTSFIAQELPLVLIDAGPGSCNPVTEEQRRRVLNILKTFNYEPLLDLAQVPICYEGHLELFAPTVQHHGAEKYGGTTRNGREGLAHVQ